MDLEYVDPDEEYARGRVGEMVHGKWKLQRLLGVGGMAAVYAAVDPEGSRVAIKLLHPQMSRRADIRERFLREGLTANRVGHPGVVKILDQGAADGHTAMLVMELLEGHSLTDLLKREGGVPLSELLGYLEQILDALAAAHERGIIHRDLKPDNLFVTNEGRVKVLDFGIARVVGDIPGQHKTKTGMTLGTVPFMAPEQALGRRNEIDGRTDLFAIGAMAFRILSGRHIHVAESDSELLIAMASRPAPPLESVAPSVPAPVCSVVDVALAFSKEARYPDARTMLEDVRALRRGDKPPYAGRKVAARDVATKVELAAPVVVALAPPPGAPLPPTRAANALPPPAVPPPPTRVASIPNAPPPTRALTAAAPLPSAATVVAPPPTSGGVTPTRAVTVVTPPPVASTGGAPTAPIIAAAGGAASQTNPEVGRHDHRASATLLWALGALVVGAIVLFLALRLGEDSADSTAEVSVPSGGEDLAQNEVSEKPSAPAAQTSPAAKAAPPETVGGSAATPAARQGGKSRGHGRAKKKHGE